MAWTLDQLHCFVTSAEQGSFSAAARKLGRPQSRISTAVSNLEIEMNLELFDRGAKYPVLTESGQKLLAYASAVIEQNQLLINQLELIALGHESHFSFAIDEAIPLSIIENSLVELDIAFPELTLSLMHGAGTEVAEFILNDEAQLGLVLQSQPLDSTLISRSITFSKMVLVVAKGHDLTRREHSLKQSDLIQYRQFVVGDPDRPDVRPMTSIYWWVDSYYYALQMVAKSDGWAFLPDFLLSEHEVNQVVEKIEVQGLAEQKPLQLALVAKRHSRESQIGAWLSQNLAKAF